jgi:hypothetical protein
VADVAVVGAADGVPVSCAGAAGPDRGEQVGSGGVGLSVTVDGASCPREVLGVADTDPSGRWCAAPSRSAVQLRYRGGNLREVPGEQTLLAGLQDHPLQATEGDAAVC